MNLRSLLVILFILLPLAGALAQLSEGKGETTFLSVVNCSIYLPRHFKVMDNGAGVMHNATGTIVTIVKVPSDKKSVVASRSSQSMRDILVDPRMTDVQFRAMDQARSTAARGKAASDEQIYEMSYKLQDIDFERINIIIPYKRDQYLVVANYTIRYKDQVKEEVDRIIKSIDFRN